MSTLVLEPAPLPIASTSAVTLDYDSLLTPAALRASLFNLQEQESAIDVALSALISSREQIDALTERLDALAPLVGHTHVDAHDLAARVDATANVAERISGKVRVLDLEQSRVKESIEMVQAVQDLKTGLQIISTAVDRGDWETATRQIQRAMQIDPAIVNSKFAEAVVPTSDLHTLPPQAIEDFRTSLCARFLKEFETASQARDEANTSRYFKLFPMIGHEETGLDAYAKFVCALVSGRSKATQTQKATSPFFFASILTPLFEQIANIIAQHQPVVEKYYGRGKMARVGAKLQEECDRQGSSILSQWEEERRIGKKLMDIRTYRFQHLASLSAAPLSRPFNPPFNAPFNVNAPFRQPVKPAVEVQMDDDIVDAREVDSLLSELAQMSGRWELYRRFLYFRLKVAPSTAPDSGPLSWQQEEAQLSAMSPTIASVLPSANVLPTAISEAPSQLDADLELVEQSPLRETLHEHMQRTYAPLELWYFKHSLEKAHQLDEADTTAKPSVTSVLDDAFYLVKTVLTRVCHTTHAPAVVAVCKELKAILERDLTEVLRRRLEAALAANQYGKAVAYLNDLDMAAEYIGRIADEPSLVSTNTYFIAAELDAAQGAVAALKSASESAFRSAHRSGLDNVFGSIARSKIRQLVADVYRDISYTLTDESYAEAEYADAVRKRFARHWDALTSLPRSSMTEGTYLSFFGLAVNALVRPWEAHIRGLRYTELGALRYDRDLRGVLSHLSNQTPLATGALRDAFARLQQIGTLLNLDSAEDAGELVASPGWKLGAIESQAAVKLRIDL